MTTDKIAGPPAGSRRKTLFEIARADRYAVGSVNNHEGTGTGAMVGFFG